MLYIFVYEKPRNEEGKPIVRSHCQKVLEALGRPLGEGRVPCLEEGLRPPCAETGRKAFQARAQPEEKHCGSTGQVMREEAALRGQSRDVVEDKGGWHLVWKPQNARFKPVGFIVLKAKGMRFKALAEVE